MPDRLLPTLLAAVGLLLTTVCAFMVLPAGAGTGSAVAQAGPLDTLGAFFDDMGRSIRQTTRKITGGTPPRRQRPSTPAAGGLALKIERSALVPTEVHTGEEVTLILRYAISGAPAKGVVVREKSTLGRGGKNLTVLKDESGTKENGTWENTLSFAVPGSAKPGQYTVSMQVSAQGQTRSTRHAFTVR
ncbi:hypothetical protein [Desulfobulbus elongatus]|uniref:hypothetical protein n=1 Tax=Desulfobulbus elongatus TaxID=53332 RepID=UPI0012FCC669|nr:hypothetical protein [Desulfobulbus elongatus]